MHSSAGVLQPGLQRAVDEQHMNGSGPANGWNGHTYSTETVGASLILALKMMR